MARNEMTVTVSGHWTYEAPCYGAPWKMETRHVWKFVDDAGNIFVWKTNGFLSMKIPPIDGKYGHFDGYDLDFAHKGDIVKITGTVKEITDYNGEKETVLSRVKMTAKLFDAEKERKDKIAAREAEKAAKKDALMSSIKDGDEIITMDYTRYKAHYSDCETVPDSYKDYIDPRGFRTKAPTIDVIVRAGRMKNSGTRGKNFHTYIMECVIDGEPTLKYVYAISPDTAAKRLRKDFPGVTDIKVSGVTHNSWRYAD